MHAFRSIMHRMELNLCLDGYLCRQVETLDLAERVKGLKRREVNRAPEIEGSSPPPQPPAPAERAPAAVTDTFADDLMAGESAFPTAYTETELTSQNTLNAIPYA
jgi:hypothetical protein